MDLLGPLVNHLTDVIIGETCQRRLMGDGGNNDYKFMVRARGYMANMAYFLNKYRRTGFPVADAFFSQTLQDFREVAAVAMHHFNLPSCELMLVEKSRLLELRGMGSARDKDY